MVGTHDDFMHINEFFCRKVQIDKHTLMERKDVVPMGRDKRGGKRTR